MARVQSGYWGRGLDVHKLLEPWAIRTGMMYHMDNGQVAVGLDLLLNEEHDEVVRFIVKRLKDVANNLIDETHF
jgi:hypothetical protein